MVSQQRWRTFGVAVLVPPPARPSAHVDAHDDAGEAWGPAKTPRLLSGFRIEAPTPLKRPTLYGAERIVRIRVNEKGHTQS